MTTFAFDRAQMPFGIGRLPVDRRGYVIPWFVDRRADKDGEPDFQVTAGRAAQAEKGHPGAPLLGLWPADPRGPDFAFVSPRPMCGVNRDQRRTAGRMSRCACRWWSARACLRSCRSRSGCADGGWGCRSTARSRASASCGTPASSWSWICRDPIRPTGPVACCSGSAGDRPPSRWVCEGRGGVDPLQRIDGVGPPAWPAAARGQGQQGRPWKGVPRAGPRMSSAELLQEMDTGRMISTSLYAEYLNGFRARREALAWRWDPESLRSCILIQDGMFAIGDADGRRTSSARRRCSSVIWEREFPGQVNFGQGQTAMGRAADRLDGLGGQEALMAPKASTSPGVRGLRAPSTAGGSSGGPWTRPRRCGSPDLWEIRAAGRAQTPPCRCAMTGHRTGHSSACTALDVRD